MAKGISKPVGAHEVAPVSLSELIHQHVRLAIEAAVHEELRVVLGATPYERSEIRRGYRNGAKARTLTGPTGPVALTLPRATLFAGAKEWASRIAPRYQRCMPLVARLPLLSRYALSAFVLIGVVLGSSGTNAQPQGRPYRIGVLNNSFTPGTPTVEGLRAGIKAEGLKEGRDVRFDIRSTGAEDRTVAPLAAALARENPDVIVAIGEKETRAAHVAAPETPVVFIQIPDPVAIGLVTSVARPGGLVTGVADLRTDLVPKRLELAKELLPNLRRVLVVYDAQDAASAAAARKAQETAPSLKLNVVVRAVRTQEEAVRELKTASARDVLLAPATMNLNIMELILNLNRYVVAPAIFPSSFWVQAGGVASYGVDNYAEAVQAARLVAKILRGARPADLPVEGVNKIELAINRKTLQAFGVTIPTALAVRVDRVFEGIGE